MDPLLQAEITNSERTCGSERVPVTRVARGAAQPVTAQIASEVPIALQYNGISHAVMLATEADLDDFALGFSLSEGLIDAASELYDIGIEASAQGITLALEVSSAAFARLKERRRTLAGHTGCGICGIESLGQVLRSPPALAHRGTPIRTEALARASRQLPRRQKLRRDTGATHAAAWCTLDGDVACLREDVGRHNALDKLIGALVRARLDVDSGFALVTSRASVEMVQKSAMAGISILAAVSAPTSLAVKMAAECGQTLLGFTRGAAFSVYTHGRRITDLEGR
jgi:FdhD protein